MQHVDRRKRKRDIIWFEVEAPTGCMDDKSQQDLMSCLPFAKKGIHMSLRWTARSGVALVVLVAVALVAARVVPLAPRRTSRSPRTTRRPPSWVTWFAAGCRAVPSAQPR